MTAPARGARVGLRGSLGWLVTAAQLYRRELPLVLATAVLVGVPAALVSLAAERLGGVEIGVGDVTATEVQGVAIALVAVALGTIGATVLAGALDGVMEGVAEGRLASGRFGRALGVLARAPYGRLIAADLLVTVALVVGLVLLIVPGLLLVPLLALTGPLVTIEGRGPVAAMRRSARLALRAPLGMVLVVAAPGAAVALLDALVSVTGAPHMLRIGVTGAIALLVAPYVGLLKVVAAHAVRGTPIRPPR